MNALDPIEPELILPEVIDPKNWRDNRLEFSDRKTRLDLVFSTQNNVPLIFNPAQVKAEEVDELYKLLDPKWKGKIAVQDPIPSGTGKGEGFLPQDPCPGWRRRSRSTPPDRVGRSGEICLKLRPRDGHVPA